MLNQLDIYRSVYDKMKLEHAICKIVEKSYTQGMRTTIIVPDTVFMSDIDNTLWVYSQKFFLPHGTNLDSMKEKQPIYISDIIEYCNDPDVIIFVNPGIDVINILAHNIQNNNFNTVFNNQFSEKISRLIVIYNDVQLVNSIEIFLKFVKSINFIDLIVKYYIQNNNCTWTLQL